MNYIYGVDVGGTTVKLGLFQEDGSLKEKWEIPTRKENGGAYIIEDIGAALKENIASHGMETGLILLLQPILQPRQ